MRRPRTQCRVRSTAPRRSCRLSLSGQLERSWIRDRSASSVTTPVPVGTAAIEQPQGHMTESKRTPARPTDQPHDRVLRTGSQLTDELTANQSVGYGGSRGGPAALRRR